MQRTSAHVLNKALPIVAKALGRSMNIHVTVGGTVAYSKRDAISKQGLVNIPSLPVDDPSLPIKAYGYLDHEAAHIRHTDFTVLEDGTIVTPIHKELWNRLEDIRIEKLISKAYPGVGSNLRSLAELMVKDAMFLPATPDLHPAQQLARYVTHRCRNEILGQTALAPVAELSEAVINKTLTRGAKTKLDALMSQVSVMDSSRAVADLAKRILDMIKEEQEKEDQQSSEDDAGNNDSSETEDGDEAQGGKGGPDDEADPESDDASGRSNDQHADALDEDQGSDGNVSPEEIEAAKESMKEMLEAGSDDLTDKDMGEMLAEQLSQEAQEAFSEGTEVYGGVAEPDPLTLINRGGQELVNAVRRETSVLTRHLSGMLDSQRDEESWLDTSGASIDDNCLDRLITGDPRIFLRTSSVVAVNTAVQVLIDRSESMEKDMDIALKSALSIALALEQIPDVSVSVACFPGYTDLGVIPMIGFGQSVRAHAGYFASVVSDGGTPMTEAVNYGLNNLLCQKEERRILLVVTDGGPNNRVSCQQAIETCEAFGVEVYGLGINCTAVEGLFPNHAVIRNIGELTQSMFTLMQTALSSRAA